MFNRHSTIKKQNITSEISGTDTECLIFVRIINAMRLTEIIRMYLGLTAQTAEGVHIPGERTVYRVTWQKLVLIITSQPMLLPKLIESDV